MLIKALDILRIVLVFAAFFFGYGIERPDAAAQAAAQLHFMAPVIICAIAGLSGIEGLFFGRQAARAKGFEEGSNYQRQSAIALLSYTCIAILVYFLEWGPRAELAVLFCFLFFFVFSAVNHAVDAVRRKNYRWANINRPFLTLLMISGLVPVILSALKYH